MTNDEIKDFALSLAKADAEEKVVNILKNSGFWDDETAWREYGDNSMNFSTIANQSSFADHALVEKLINSVDAILMRECLRRRIKLDGPDAPRSIADAQKEFFGIPDGRLSRMDGKQRAKLADNILLVATGSRSKPSFAIIDRGEGQTPNSIPETILSLTKENKIKIPFVQGKFGMGGSGVLRFCSPERHLQLLISKRDIEIPDTDPTRELWGVTVIRKEEPKEGMRSSHYTYLAPQRRVLSFAAPALPLLPKSHPEAFGAPLESGTYVKLYEYEIGGLRTVIILDLYYRLSLLMPDVALPIRMVERRNYKAHSHENTLAGLSVRLDEDRSENLEPEFQTPGTGEMTIDGEKFDYAIYVFKKGKKENYARNEGVVFSINGQAHGFLRKAFFERQSVGMSYLSDSILVAVDCSKISRKMQEKLFMPSRDRLAQTPFLSAIERELEGIIKSHSGLKELRNRRRQEALKDKMADSKPLAELLTDIIKKSPTLSRLLGRGERLRDPFDTRRGAAKEQNKNEFQGRQFPTYFELTRNYAKEKPKVCAINRKFRIEYKTDAENDYFNRDKDPGKFTLRLNGSGAIRDYSLNLWNGLATLTMSLPQGLQVGDLRGFETEVSDIDRVTPYQDEFWIQVEKESQASSANGGRQKPPSGEKGRDRRIEDNLDLPQVVEIWREDWEKDEYREFHLNRNSALKAKAIGDGKGYDFYINMDNVCLKNEMKEDRRTEPKILEERYRTGMVLLGMSILHHAENNSGGGKGDSDPNENGAPAHEQISEFTEAISPVLLPMIASLGDLKEEA